MRISDWSSDVCSSDLRVLARCPFRAGTGPADGVVPDVVPAPAEPESRDIREHSGLPGIQGHGPGCTACTTGSHSGALERSWFAPRLHASRSETCDSTHCLRTASAVRMESRAGHGRESKRTVGGFRRHLAQRSVHRRVDADGYKRPCWPAG